MKTCLTPNNYKAEVYSSSILYYMAECLEDFLSRNIQDYITIGYEPSDPSVGIMQDGIFLDNLEGIQPITLEVEVIEDYEEILNCVDFITEEQKLILKIPQKDKVIYTYAYTINQTIKRPYNKNFELENIVMDIDFKFQIRLNHYNPKTKKYYLLLDFIEAEETK